MPIQSDALDRLEPLMPAIAARAVAVDRQAAFPDHTLAALREVGLLGLLTPTQHGGLGGDVVDGAHVVERLARACASSAMVVCMHYCGAAVIAAHGSAAVNRAIASGEHLSTLAFSEAGSRSHFWAPTSTARYEGDVVVLDARKSMATSARHATAYVWSSRPAVASGLSTLWLVERDRPGIAHPVPFDGMGLRGNDSSPIEAHGVRIPAANRLGEDGGGFDLMMGTVLPAFQVMNAACSLGICEAALQAAAGHVQSARLEHAGDALSALPTVRAYLAKARVQADMARALWEDTLSALRAGRADAMIKVLESKAAAGDTALEVASVCMRVCGGAAYRRELGVERNFRDAQAATVMGPTSDVLYDFIGKAVCGLPLFE